MNGDIKMDTFPITEYKIVYQTQTLSSQKLKLYMPWIKLTRNKKTIYLYEHQVQTLFDLMKEAKMKLSDHEFIEQCEKFNLKDYQ